MEVILHVPHTSTSLGNERNSILLDDEALKLELSYDTDWGADELFSEQLCKHSIIWYKSYISRIICDVERFIPDELDKYGRGFIYTKDVYGRRLKKDLTPEEYNKILTYYTEYHSQLNNLVRDSISKQGKALIIDCHTFCNKSITTGGYVGETRIEINIGVSSTNTPKYLSQSLQKALSSMGYTIGINNPFSGTMIPQNYIDNKLVESIMVEVNRDKFSEQRFMQLQYNLTNWLNTLGG